MEAKKRKADERYLNIAHINVLPQMRRTFDGTQELAESIHRNGLIHPVTVAELNDKEARGHLNVINSVQKTHVRFSNLRPRNRKFLILVAGERRIRAHKYLQELYGGYRIIRTTVCPKMSSEDLIALQGSENTNRSVRPEEEAIFYYRFYNYLKKVREKITLMEFGRMV